MNINIDLIIKVIIPILGAIITYILVPLIKEKTTKEQRENAYSCKDCCRCRRANE